MSHLSSLSQHQCLGAGAAQKEPSALVAGMTCPAATNLEQIEAFRPLTVHKRLRVYFSLRPRVVVRGPTTDTLAMQSAEQSALCFFSHPFYCGVTSPARHIERQYTGEDE